MLYTLCVCALVIFSLIGLSSVCRLLLMLLRKPKKKSVSIVILPMGTDDRENAGAIAYTSERLNLFGEDRYTKIIALEKDGSDCEQLERMFEDCKAVSFASLGEVESEVERILGS